jgi:NAD(P)-dependent dehydrogenase (short-subunit alcohol dehydrogenase family)
MKTVLITGSNRGIGKALTEYYLNRGFVVYAGVRTLDKTVTDNPNFRQLQLDVEDDDSIKAAVAHIKNESKVLHVLINNAGISKRSAGIPSPESVSHLGELDRTALLKMMDVNSISPVIVAKYAVPLMTDADSFIINVSSLRATYENSADGSGNYGYSSSKLALNMLTLCLAYDLAENISTFAVHPGSVKTDMNSGGTMTPLESAEAIGQIIQNWRPEYNGRFLNYNGQPLS